MLSVKIGAVFVDSLCNIAIENFLRDVKCFSTILSSAIFATTCVSVLDGPRKRVLEGHDEVDEGPANNNVVIGCDAKGCQY